MSDRRSFYFPLRHARRALMLIAVSTAISVIAGCSNLGVKPWERDLLADPDMQLTVSGVDAGLDDHIYFSKEASSGGRGFGGGGCGCN
ncbi:DUF4266 domain-containing protein [Marinobacter sp.]|uniref:DUF4266 domain-containing protein n=1 Tax=Marinobacter sp. TaxID=50741 RepID=UPI003A8E7CBB